MPISYDKRTKRYRYQLRRTIAGRRIRARKILPATWTRAQAEEFDRLETARIIADATGVERRDAAIESAVLHYLSERVPSLKSAKSVRDDLAVLHPYYKGRTLRDLPNIAREYIAATSGTLTARTAQKRLALLRAACRYAWKRHGMGGDADPTARMVLPTVRNARHVYLDRVTVLTIARAMPRETRGNALLSYYTGMRLSETIAAINRDGIALELTDTKNGTPRLVPIHPRVAIYARKHTRKSRSAAAISVSFARAAQRLGIENVRLHDLRHSAASAMINAGVDLYTVGAVLGHRTPTSTARYAHLAQSTLRDAISKIGQTDKQGQKSAPGPQTNKPKKAA